MICRFPAEPPQEGIPSGRWAETLQAEFLAACLRLSQEPDEQGETVALGEVGPLVYHPDRTWCGRTYIPVTARTDTGLDVFGLVSFVPPNPDSAEPAEREPQHFSATADFTDETADRHPEWKLDLCDEVIGGWRGEHGRVAAMTVVWGVSLSGGAIVTAELAGLTVDQCLLVDDRFTLIAPDAYQSDYVEIRLWDRNGRELARESLYEEDEE
ncbi:MAG: hypothetical protein QOE86_4453 [Solirubrobacteraceae bacterium]|nr:hypothetical protein [Solirubrobacteraceae bacterium]